MLLDRRSEQLFTFYTDGAVQKRFIDFKEWMIKKQIMNANNMIIHDMRRIALIFVEKHYGPKFA